MHTEAEKSVTRSCIVNGQEAVFHCWGQGSTEKKLKSGEYGVNPDKMIEGGIRNADGKVNDFQIKKRKEYTISKGETV